MHENTFAGPFRNIHRCCSNPQCDISKHIPVRPVQGWSSELIWSNYYRDNNRNFDRSRFRRVRLWTYTTSTRSHPRILQSGGESIFLLSGSKKLGLSEHVNVPCRQHALTRLPHPLPLVNFCQDWPGTPSSYLRRHFFRTPDLVTRMRTRKQAPRATNAYAHHCQWRMS